MSDAIKHFAFPVLIGDIGGTNARFALLSDEDAAIDRIPNLGTADFNTIGDAIAEALAEREAAPKTAILALAGPITGDRVPLTNCDWIVEPKALIQRFDLDDVILLNDFEAQSLALPGLGPDDLDPIGSGNVTPTGARVVVGPGTGLGAGALVHTRNMWVPIPGEGGHIDLGPVSRRDFELWPHIELTFGRMSAETILSGSGLLRLYKGVCALNGFPAPLDDEAHVTAAGLDGEDHGAVEALDLFATYLGRFAGDLAMVFAAHGGVYLAGGIPVRILPALKSGTFRRAFLAKEPHADLLEGIATAVIVKRDAALAGITDFARRPHGFGVELGGRRWQS
ncbi:glucokinase [Bauldia sp.]|uniref:glucokinase n=1 Tax=Bauldia sp. TaxID=2575872 RepID=UPI003BACE703